MERIVKQNLLYDFYGELLTEHQRQIYEDAIFNDMSLSEISENYGITRQGVHDIIKRCDRALADYEDKLKLIARFERVRGSVYELSGLIRRLLEHGKESGEDELDRTLEHALGLTEDILAGL